MQNLIAKAEILMPEEGCKPRVYYLNLPKKFIGGTVYDPVEEEVLIGADVTIMDISARRLAELDDIFGPAGKTLYSNPYNIQEALPEADLRAFLAADPRA